MCSYIVFAGSKRTGEIEHEVASADSIGDIRIEEIVDKLTEKVRAGSQDLVRWAVFDGDTKYVECLGKFREYLAGTGK